MLLGASPQFVESPWAVAGLSSRDTANGTARGATVDHNVVPCFSSAISSAKISDGFVGLLATGIAVEQAQTFIAKGRTLTLEEFEYAPESHFSKPFCGVTL